MDPDLWSRIRNSLWFVPGLIVLLAVGLAILLIELSSTIGTAAADRWPLLFGVGADGSRGMLTAIATSMATVAGVVFSITIVTLSLASSQYSSRVLRNFMTDRTNQAVLGVFVGIFVYCLVVLRTIRGGEHEVVPSLAVLGGVVLAVVGIGYLVYFIHHIAEAIQASHILAAVTTQTIRTIERVCPDGSPGAEPGAPPDPWPDGPRHLVRASCDGYVQRVDAPGLLELAADRQASIRVLRGVGEFVVEGTPLADVGGAEPSGLERAVQRRIVIGRQRALDHDLAYGIRQIVDVALKALSPGINDTTTAVMAVDYLSAILGRLTGRRLPEAHCTDRSGAQVELVAPRYDELLGEAFDQIRRQAEGNVAVLEALVRALRVLADRTGEPERRAVLKRHALVIRETVVRSVPWPAERRRLEEATDGLIAGL
jgi:uncharacterized membrane protein